MKRSLLFIILFICISSMCFAVTKTINIQGGYDAVSSVKITPIPSQTESYKMGMPFSIDDLSVIYRDGQRGRKIANWNILANYKMIIDVEAEIMHNYTESETTSASYDKGLGYILEFTYTMSYFKDNKVQSFPEMSFKLEVGRSVTSKIVKIQNIDLLKGQTIDMNTLAGSADGGVYFMFDQDTSNNVINNPTEFTALPNGNYLATVTFFMRADE